MKSKTESFGYTVEIEQKCTNDYHDGEQYGEWSKSYDNRYQSIQREDDCPNLMSSIELKDGETAYLVWIEYSTGDSFGRADRGSVDAMGLFLDMNAAREFAKFIRAFEKNSDREDRYKFDYTALDGQHFHIGFTPWIGYFERLDNVYIETVSLNKKKGREVY